MTVMLGIFETSICLYVGKNMHVRTCETSDMSLQKYLDIVPPRGIQYFVTLVFCLFSRSSSLSCFGPVAIPTILQLLFPCTAQTRTCVSCDVPWFCTT